MLKYFQEILLIKYTYYTNTFKDILISNIHIHNPHMYEKDIHHIYYIQEYTHIKYYHTCMKNTYIIYKSFNDVFILIFTYIYLICISTQ
jgi:hypothetical protein